VNETQEIAVTSLAASPVPSLFYSAVLNGTWSGPAKKKKRMYFLKRCGVMPISLWWGGFSELRLERKDGKSKNTNA